MQRLLTALDVTASLLALEIVLDCPQHNHISTAEDKSLYASLCIATQVGVPNCHHIMTQHTLRQ